MKSPFSFLCLALAFMVGCNSAPADPAPAQDATTPSGTTATNQPEANEADFRAPFYPGSTEVAGSYMSVMATSEENFVVERMTKDEPQKVADFYKSELEGATINPFGTMGFMIEWKSKDDFKVAITALRKEGETETKIGMAVAKVTEAAAPTGNTPATNAP